MAESAVKIFNSREFIFTLDELAKSINALLLVPFRLREENYCVLIDDKRAIPFIFVHLIKNEKMEEEELIRHIIYNSEFKGKLKFVKSDFFYLIVNLENDKQNIFIYKIKKSKILRLLEIDLVFSNEILKKLFKKLFNEQFYSYTSDKKYKIIETLAFDLL